MDCRLPFNTLVSATGYSYVLKTSRRRYCLNRRGHDKTVFTLHNCKLPAPTNVTRIVGVRSSPQPTNSTYRPDIRVLSNLKTKNVAGLKIGRSPHTHAAVRSVGVSSMVTIPGTLTISSKWFITLPAVNRLVLNHPHGHIQP